VSKLNILVIRLSAFGDVAISVHVLRAAIEQNPDIKIILLTRKAFQPLFANIDRIEFIEPDLYGKHKNIWGLYKLFKEINNSYKIDLIIDLHDVIRSKILSFFYFFKAIKTYKIDKGRKEKKELIKNNIKKQLKTSVERYANVFLQAKIKVNLKKQYSLISSPKESNWIGIAPFALHKQKTYPLDKMEKLIQQLDKANYKIHIFGGGKKEKEFAEGLEKTNKNVVSLVSKFSLLQELEMMSKMQAMITMDSANMHLAALTDTKIISIWGGTHPFAGFTAFAPSNRNFIIQKELDCRPCSIFGNKKCYKNTIECMDISPEIIKQTLDKAIQPISYT